MAGLMEKVKNFVTDKIVDVPKPEASIEDVDLKNFNKSGVTYNAKVGVTNPYSHSIPICEITFSLSSASKFVVSPFYAFDYTPFIFSRVIASGKIPDPGSIKENGTTMLEVPMLVPHNILMSLAKDIWRDWDIDYELVLGLIVDLPVIGNFTIPLTTNGEIKLPTLGGLFGGGGDDDEKKDDK